MKIALTHVDLPNESKGGVAHQVHDLANALSDRGHEVTMFTFSPACADCRYQVHQYPSMPRMRRFQSFLFAAHLARTDFSAFDVLHTNGDNYLLWQRSPQLRTFYGSAKDEADSAVRLRRRLYQLVIAHLEKLGAQTADMNVGISEATRARIPTISKVIPCGVDITRFHPGPKAAHPAILFVGTTGGRKRGQFLANIFEYEVRPQFPNAELWSVADRPMVGEGIVNFGRVDTDTLAKLFQHAWIFCLPSTYEGFGVPYIEAMAAGTAIVASPNPGAREVLAEGKYGVLARDAEIGANINTLLENHQQRQLYITQGLERAREFVWERVAEQYEHLYSSLLIDSSLENFVSGAAGTTGYARMNISQKQNLSAKKNFCVKPIAKRYLPLLISSETLRAEMSARARLTVTACALSQVAEDTLRLYNMGHAHTT